jgi:hypothetical protein
MKPIGRQVSRSLAWLTTIIAAAVAGVAACSGSASLPSAIRQCTPGATQMCVGPGGCVGGQACSANGQGFDPCVCGGQLDGSSGDATLMDAARDSSTDATTGDAVGDAGSDTGTVMDSSAAEAGTDSGADAPDANDASDAGDAGGSDVDVGPPSDSGAPEADTGLATDSGGSEAGADSGLVPAYCAGSGSSARACGSGDTLPPWTYDVTYSGSAGTACATLGADAGSPRVSLARCRQRATRPSAPFPSRSAPPPGRSRTIPSA